MLQKILSPGNLDFTVQYHIYPSFFLNRMRLFMGCLNKSMIKTGTELGNPEDQEAPAFDIKICRNKSISSASRQKKKENQDPNKINEISVTNPSVTKISLKTMDSIKGITMWINNNFPKKLRPIKQAGESNVNIQYMLRVHFLPQYVMETMELFQGLPNFWLVMSKQMWKLHLKGNKNPSVSISRMSGIGQFLCILLHYFPVVTNVLKRKQIPQSPRKIYFLPLQHAKTQQLQFCF